MARDDTSGYSSLDGSMDNLAPRAPSGSPAAMDVLDASPNRASKPPPLSTGTGSRPNRCSLTASDMPTVIVSAAPDVDSAEEGSDTSADDGLGGIGEGNFARSAFGSELELLGPTHLSLDDLPGQITRLLGKSKIIIIKNSGLSPDCNARFFICSFPGKLVCTQLLVSSSPGEENVSQFVGLLDRCLSHEAFTQRQRRRLASWKEQAHRIWSNLPPSGSGNVSRNTSGGGGGIAGTNNGGGPQKSSETRFARRWSNVAHYPGFYSADAGSSAAQTPFGCAPPNAYSLFPPRQQQQQQRGSLHPSPCPSPRPLFAGQSPTHNSYGQHTHHAAGNLHSNLPAEFRFNRIFFKGPNATLMRPGLAPTTPLPPPPHNPHSLQVGSHLALQHRNSFCVSALSHQSSLYSSQQSYSPLSSCGGAPDPFTFSHPHRMHFDELPSEVRLFPPFSFLFFFYSPEITFGNFSFNSRHSPAGWASNEPGQRRWLTAWPTVCSAKSEMLPKWI